MNFFDYAISYDDNLHLDDRCMRFPILKYHRINIDETVDNPIQYLSEKTKFCNFIYSNPDAHPMRDNLFHKITEYKKVDALGVHLNNCENKSPRLATNWQGESIELKRPYKFSIAAENAQHKGYTSEKILTAFKAHSIPIYWGNPNIARDFNPKSFINCHDFPDLDAVLQRVKEVDNNDELWLDIMSQPRRTKEQIELYHSDIKNFNAFLKNIFDQDIQDAKRTPEGWLHDIIQKRCFHCYSHIFKTHTSFLWGLIKRYRDGDKRTIKLFNFIKFSYTSHKRQKKLERQNSAK